MPGVPTDDGVAAVVRAVHGPPEHWTPVTEGAYSRAQRWIVRWPDGRSAFVKAAHDDYTRRELATEHLISVSVAAPFVPRLIDYSPGDDGVPAVLLLEDLSTARWGIPLVERDAHLLSDALDQLEAVTPPPGFGPHDLGTHWAAFAADPTELLATGLVDQPWLDGTLPTLIAAESDVDTTGDRLVHMDLWLQNWCRAPRGAVIVDWAGAALGDITLCRAWGEASIRAGAGPHGIVMPPGCPPYAAWMAGLAAHFLADDGPTASPRLLETMRREGFAAMCWACDELDLPHPEPRSGFHPSGPWRP